MKISFTKMHGLGNDFIVIADFENNLPEEEFPNWAKKFCHRRFGVGADGLIVVKPHKLADFEMCYTNADGTEAEMCGNGIRCVGKFLYENGIRNESNEYKIMTGDGIKTISLEIENKSVKNIRVGMGIPDFDVKSIPFFPEDGEEIFLKKPIPLKTDTGVEGSLVSMGNPHLVVRREKISDDWLTKYAPILEKHESFPFGINTEVIEVIDEHLIKMRVWERGCGETMACGTGACATAAVGIRNEWVKSPVKVELLGGSLYLEWEGDGEEIFMTGSAETVFQGILELD